MSYVPPADVATAMVDAGQKKTGMATRETLIKATMAGAILALAAALATTITVNTGEPLLGAMIFPVGFILLYLMGFDLVTGVFTLVPLAWIDKRPGVTWRSLLRNWGWICNFSLALYRLSECVDRNKSNEFVYVDEHDVSVRTVAKDLTKDEVGEPHYRPRRRAGARPAGCRSRRRGPRS